MHYHCPFIDYEKSVPTREITYFQSNSNQNFSLFTDFYKLATPVIGYPSGGLLALWSNTAELIKIHLSAFLPESTMLSNGRDILSLQNSYQNWKTSKKIQRGKVDPGHEKNFITTHDSHTIEEDV